MLEGNFKSSFRMFEKSINSVLNMFYGGCGCVYGVFTLASRIFQECFMWGSRVYSVLVV